MLLAKAVWSVCDGLWDEQKNWSTGAVPGSKDDVVIDAPNCTITRTTDSTIGSLSLSSGRVRGDGETLTILGLFTWTGGELGGNGRTDANGGMHLTGTFKNLNQRILNNAQTADWYGGSISGLALQHGRLNNLAGATFNVYSNGTFLYDRVMFNNAGTIRKFSSGTTSFGSRSGFINSGNGAVEIQSGTLHFTGDGVGCFSGTYTVAAGATLQLSAAAQNLTADCSLTGDGNVEIRNTDYSTVASPISIGGNLVLGHGVTVSSSTVVAGGTLGIVGIPPVISGSQVQASALLVGTPAPAQPSMAWITFRDGATLTLSTDAVTIHAGGVVRFSDDFVHAPTNLLTIEIGGTGANRSGRFSVGGQASFDGVLEVVQRPGYQPRVGECFTVATAGLLQSTFADILGLELGGDLYLEPWYDKTSLTLCVSARLTLNQSQLLQLWDVFENPEHALTQLTAKIPEGNGVVYSGYLYDTPANPYSPFVQMGIGANYWGQSSTGSGPTTRQVLGTNDLSTYGAYGLMFTNVDDRPWSVSLCMNTGYIDPPYYEPDNFYQSGFVELAPGQSATLVLNFNALGVIHRDHVSNICFQIGGDVTQPNPDSFRILVSPALGGPGMPGGSGADTRTLQLADAAASAAALLSEEWAPDAAQQEDHLHLMDRTTSTAAKYLTLGDNLLGDTDDLLATWPNAVHRQDLATRDLFDHSSTSYLALVCDKLDLALCLTARS